ncbi:UDP-N-acetylmuramate--L-alanine ligase [Desertihabitans aurantiacus]|uniref:UDP-N-acetylmuramate--L-alanine ligase n=1 Tax=Desertihabitans aurantiacus TaxID=2282477 RepID=UPI000DF85E11|nr:UDP-N-acetylmuramate--L-alanine ligase [Desertihabitans aurantiacus]
MGLVEPVELVTPDQLGPVHFIAVGGSGMSGIASLYAELGLEVSGSDRADSPVLATLAARGVRTFVGHAAEQLGSARTVVVSTAVGTDNPELVEAHRRGLRVWHRSAALAALMLPRPSVPAPRGVAVGGTAGKTTTSAMVASALVAAGADPTFVVGAPLQRWGTSARLGSGPVVVEADESDGSFLQYPAEVVVVTNVEPDHLDNWGTPAAYADGFARFAGRPGVGAAVLCADDPGCQALAERLAELGDDGPEQVLYGESPLSDLVLEDITVHATRTTARLTWRGGETGLLRVPGPGHHLALDAAAAYAVCRLLGVDHETALAGLADFGGTARRFQLVADVGGVRVVDDYAHHPAKVRAALTSGRAAAGGRLVVCFQPHLFSRTRDFADDFGAALALADEVVLMDVYPAREEPLPGVDSGLVADACAARLGAEHVHWVRRREEVVPRLRELVHPGDLVMTVGAGDVTTVGPELVRALAGPGGVR